MFSRLFGLYNRLYFREFFVLGTVAGITGGVADFTQFQFEKISYYDKLSLLVEKTQSKPELLNKLTELNLQAKQINERSQGFLDSIVGTVELTKISIEQQEITKKLQSYDNITSELTLPSHLWLNLSDSFSFGITKSIAIGGILGSGITSFYYVTLPLFGLHNAVKQYKILQIHTEDLKKSEQCIEKS